MFIRFILIYLHLILILLEIKRDQVEQLEERKVSFLNLKQKHFICLLRNMDIKLIAYIRIVNHGKRRALWFLCTIII